MANPTPASQTSRTSKSPNQSEPSFWDKLGTVGENNTVYNMDSQGSSDIQTRNAQTQAQTEKSVPGWIQRQGIDGTPLISDYDFAPQAGNNAEGGRFIKTANGPATKPLFQSSNPEVDPRQAELNRQTANGFASTVVSALLGGEGQQKLTFEELTAWRAANPDWRSFGAPEPTLSYDIDLANWSYTRNIGSGATLGGKVVNALSMGTKPVGESLGTFIGAMSVASDTSMSWGIRSQAAYDIGANALSIPAAAGMVLSGPGVFGIGSAAMSDVVMSEFMAAATGRTVASFDGAIAGGMSRMEVATGSTNASISALRPSSLAGEVYAATTKGAVGVNPIYYDKALGLSAYDSTSVVSHADLSRLALDGYTRTGAPVWRTGEGLAAAEFEKAFDVRLDRIDKNNWSTPNPPDFVIRGGNLDGKTVDFLYTVDSGYAKDKLNANFLVNAKAERNMVSNLIKHVNKADFVPMDFRTLTPANQQKLVTNVMPKLTAEQRAKLLIIK